MVDLVNDRFLLTGAEVRRGGNAEVRKAVDVRDGSAVAVKFLRPTAVDEAVKLFFDRETATLRTLAHPNIVRLIDAGWDAQCDRYYLALEWIETSLADNLRDEGPFTWEPYLQHVGLPLAGALTQAHLLEVEHRDIKPANVLMTSDGSPKLADFGIAKIQSHVDESAPTVAHYRSGVFAPPELDGSIRFVRDVYGFGVMAIQAMTTDRLGDYAQVLPALDALELPAELRTLLRECVDVDPAARPANGAVLEQRLTEVYELCHARITRRASTVWLRLTEKVARSVLDTAPGSALDYDRAAATVLEELSGEVHAEFKYDPRTKTVDHTAIALAGRDYDYLLVEDRVEADRFAITSARRHDEDRLERTRRRALNLGNIVTWTFRKPSAGNAARGARELFDALYAHHAAAAATASGTDKPSDAELFEHWRHLLDAREDLERGQRQPHDYQGFVARGRSVEFRLQAASEGIQVGEEWEVFDPRARRTIDRGDVVAIGEESVSIRFRRAGRRLPESGQLHPSLGPTQVSLNRQRDALTQLATGELELATLRDLILNPAHAAGHDPVEITTWSRPDLDESKRLVVRHALGSQDLLIVEGPPGTGKTTVIAEIVEQALRRDPGLRILLVSQTHIAIDNALGRLEAAGVTNLVRLGRPDDPRVDEATRHLLQNRQMAIWAQQARERAQAHIARLAERRGIDERHLRCALLLEELVSLLATIRYLEERLEHLAGIATHGVRTTSSAEAEDLVETQARLEENNDAKSAKLAEAKSLLAGDLTLREDLDESDARAAVEALIGTTSEAQQLMKLLRLQGEWLQRLETDQGLMDAFIKTRSVVGGTAIGFLGHRAVRDTRFDVCIFDEASKATATEALVPLTRARRWILIGDTRQLPPVDEELLRQSELMNLYRLTPEIVKTTLFQRLAEASEPPVRHLLREQYRMIAPIGDLISSCFYEDKLISPRTDELPGLSSLCKPILWLNTASMGQRRREEGGGPANPSYSNRTEATIALNWLKKLDLALAREFIAPPDGRALEVLLIAPYGKQVKELQRRHAATALDHLRISVLSVDAVQGREADLAVFSVTRSNDRGRLGFLGAEYWRRINVALSRARYGLVVVGDAGFCRAADGALRDVLVHIDSHRQTAEVRDARDA